MDNSEAQQKMNALKANIEGVVKGKGETVKLVVIALVSNGHPVGATGNRVVTTIIEVLRDRDATIGLATMCIGGGQGSAMILERLS